MHVFNHWREVPAETWRWPDFSPEEIACRGTGKLAYDPAALDRLQKLRDLLGAPVMVNSAYRSPEHNRRVGGAKNSFHLRGMAFDVSMANHDPQRFEGAARLAGFTGFGFYRRGNFIHVDTGPAREWGERWRKPRASRFTPEPQRASVLTRILRGWLGLWAAAT